MNEEFMIAENILSDRSELGEVIDFSNEDNKIE
jgi:hypothetical protein